MTGPAESIAARFDRYDPDHLEWLEMKKRAIKAGRTPTEQEAHEEEVRVAKYEAVQAACRAEHVARGPHSSYDRSEPYPVRGVYLIDDPINEGRF